MPRYNGGFIGTDGLDAPDAPTIGTPSAGSTQADIAFTAGAAGTTATTEFVATTNDGIGATGTSSPITITGLTNGTSYTARVYAKNSHGTSAASEASASFTPLAEVISGLFSTHLYDGTGSAQTITNGINLSGKGGAVWTKRRDSTTGSGPWFNDTERGITKYLGTHEAGTETDSSSSLSATTSTGYTLGGSFSGWNNSSGEYVSWTFRKEPKFFDIVTWTGDGTGTRNIAHNLGTTVGMIVMKQRTSSLYNWLVYHRGYTSNVGSLNQTAAFNYSSLIVRPTPSQETTHFQVSGTYNGSGETHVAYLFAHNNNDGGFGTDSEDIIKCGSYTGNASGTGPEINLGFEPQWLLVKNVNNSSSDWLILDVMRGWGMGDADIFLEANTSGADQGSQNWVDITSTGFKITNANGQINGLNQEHIYVAIRRPDQSTPTVASDVFAIDTSTSDSSGDVLASTFPVDIYLNARRDGGGHGIFARLTRARLFTDANSAEQGSLDSYIDFDRQTGIKRNALLGNASTVDYMWKRAKGFCDVVTYSGTGSNRTVSHNLGVVPEMMWIKRRDSTGAWAVYHKGLDSGNNPETHYIILNTTAAEDDVNEIFNDTAPTSSVFSLGTAASVNNSSGTYIAYLFATVAGVSKVGSVSHSFNSTTNVDCGFSSNARFVLVKSTSSGSWYIWDSVRGIVSGNDPYLALDSTAVEVTNGDLIDPYSGGFALSPGFYTDTYIFYAIA